MEKQIYALGDGNFGYRILCNGSVVTDQQFTPGAAGFVQMTEAQAHAFADDDIARMTSE